MGPGEMARGEVVLRGERCHVTVGLAQRDAPRDFFTTAPENVPTPLLLAHAPATKTKRCGGGGEGHRGGLAVLGGALGGPKVPQVLGFSAQVKLPH